MQKIWVLAADNSRARIFETSTRKALEKEVQSIVHPASRQSAQDMLSDRPGRTVHPSSSEQRKAYAPSTDPKKYEAQQFARSIGEIINKSALEKEFEKIYILAPPSFLGMLRTELSPQAREKIGTEIDKNVTQLKMEEIRQYLPDYL